MPKDRRLLSLDALRGFDMFFITGGATIVAGLCAGFGWGDGWLAAEMHHVRWAGLAHHDTIFPLFLFLAGVSWPFSLSSQLAKGRTSWQIHRKVLLRMLVLFALGLSTGGILRFDACFRIPSVLGQIGLAWGFAALLYMHVRRPLTRVMVIIALLAGYWALLALTGAPDAPAGADLYSKEWNVISWLDRTVMPNHLCVPRVYDPESLFSVPSAVALALLGMTAGAILASDRWTGIRKTGLLAALSGISLAACLAFVFLLKMPIVKALWTSSFVLAAAAYSFAMMAIFYWAVDVRGWTRWTFYFRVIGLNSITIYMLQMIGVTPLVQQFLFGGLESWTGASWQGLVQGVTIQLVCWLVLLFFYRKSIFLKV